MNYINLTKQDIEVEEKLLASYQSLLAQLPPGRLTYKHNKGKIYYYCTDDRTGRQTYISRQNKQLIYDLKQKRYNFSLFSRDTPFAAWGRVVPNFYFFLFSVENSTISCT